jgi:hypothetical protein
MRSARVAKQIISLIARNELIEIKSCIQNLSSFLGNLFAAVWMSDPRCSCYTFTHNLSKGRTCYCCHVATTNSIIATRMLFHQCQQR